MFCDLESSANFSVTPLICVDFIMKNNNNEQDNKRVFSTSLLLTCN